MMREQLLDFIMFLSTTSALASSPCYEARVPFDDAVHAAFTSNPLEPIVRPVIMFFVASCLPTLKQVKFCEETPDISVQPGPLRRLRGLRHDTALLRTELVHRIRQRCGLELGISVGDPSMNSVQLMHLGFLHGIPDLLQQVA